MLLRLVIFLNFSFHCPEFGCFFITYTQWKFLSSLLSVETTCEVEMVGLAT